MEEQATCGKGLAEHSALPAKLAELTSAVADNLEAHMTALDLDDEHSRREYEAYALLARRHRELATQLQATAKQMEGYRDLPMGRHDPVAVSAPALRTAFENFVRHEQELLNLLQHWIERDQGMLAGRR